MDNWNGAGVELNNSTLAALLSYVEEEFKDVTEAEKFARLFVDLKNTNKFHILNLSDLSGSDLGWISYGRKSKKSKAIFFVGQWYSECVSAYGENYIFSRHRNGRIVPACSETFKYVIMSYIESMEDWVSDKRKCLLVNPNEINIHIQSPRFVRECMEKHGIKYTENARDVRVTY